ncbi:MAG: class II aldolase/adducin family protein [Sphingomonadales bacterium]
MTTVSHLALRRAIIRTARETVAAGLTQGTSGNVSTRVENGFLITPSGVPCHELEPSHIPLVHFDGSYVGDREPSSEWSMHYAILRTRPEARAVVHAHPPCATALACLGRDIPAFHYMVAVAGGVDIRCAAYATFGTQELAENALKALQGRKACLLANHGIICFEADLDRALALAVEVETLAAQYWRALQIGEPNLLSPQEMERVLKRFETYGKRSGG